MSPNLLRQLDYSALQQCIHCGMCLPTCPTYDATRIERNSPRGRIALMRSIADGQLETSTAFSEEMNFCLGCLACQTACPAGVDYMRLFEVARAEATRADPQKSARSKIIRKVTLGWLFQKQSRLRLLGRLLWLYQASGTEKLIRFLRVPRLLPAWLRNAEAKTPTVRARFTPQLVKEREAPPTIRYRVGLLSGCIQDLVFSDVNRDTADVLLANDCEVITPAGQGCCGSIHAHNGDLEGARDVARRLIEVFPASRLDAIITNAGGCGAHLKHYGRLLSSDPNYSGKAKLWSSKVKDIHEWLVTIGFRTPAGPPHPQKVTCHESCHLCHGQGISRQPREILRSAPGVKLLELPEATWCCGSAGIYNLLQPDMAEKLAARKANHICSTGAEILASANPGCSLQIANALRKCRSTIDVRHPVSVLAAAYRREPPRDRPA